MKALKSVTAVDILRVGEVLPRNAGMVDGLQTLP
jgi:hypothetical protein